MLLDMLLGIEDKLDDILDLLHFGNHILFDVVYYIFEQRQLYVIKCGQTFAHISASHYTTAQAVLTRIEACAFPPSLFGCSGGILTIHVFLPVCHETLPMHGMFATWALELTRWQWLK